MALQWSHRALIQCTAALGQRYSLLLVAKPAAVDFGMVLLRDCGLSGGWELPDARPPHG